MGLEYDGGKDLHRQHSDKTLGTNEQEWNRSTGESRGTIRRTRTRKEVGGTRNEYEGGGVRGKGKDENNGASFRTGIFFAPTSYLWTSVGL
jgi:hypothetical protein